MVEIRLGQGGHQIGRRHIGDEMAGEKESHRIRRFGPVGHGFDQLVDLPHTLPVSSSQNVLGARLHPLFVHNRAIRAHVHARQQ